MPWPSGTVAATKLKVELESWIETKIKAAPYKARLPKAFYNVGAASPGRRAGGIRIEIATEADERAPHIYNDGTANVIEEYHRVAIDVKGDDKSGGMEASEAMYGVLKSLFSDPARLTELIALGICNVRENPEAEKLGDTEFERPLGLTCGTDTYL